MLTVEELKSLESGDWIWLIIKRKDWQYEQYTRIMNCYMTEISFVDVGSPNVFEFADYGTEWIAYKNKEQVEENS